MKWFARLNLGAAVLLVAGNLLCAPIERSVSPSRQFIIYGTNAVLRGSISRSAEQTKTQLLALLQQRDNWKTPIVINLQVPQANVPEIPRTAFHFSQTGSGLKIQLDLMVGADMNVPELHRELLRAILMEMIYRSQPDLAPGTVYVHPPDWLLNGVLAAGHERKSYAGALAPLVATNKVITLEQFLRQNPEHLDSPAQLLYRAYSRALVELLVDGTNGGTRLARYIENLSHASNDPLADLKAQFPMLATDDQLWQATVTKLSNAQKFELLSFAETERRLAELLEISLPEGAHLEDLITKRRSPTQRGVLQLLSENLLLLATSSNPVMRPIVAEYQEIAHLMASGKRSRLPERLLKVKATRSKLVARMNEIDDYLNWFEATQTETKSGVFVDYLRSASERDEPAPRRRDALSVYLDALETQFTN